MNRIRKIGNTYQVLITPNIKISPDNSIMVGNWDDAELRNYFILEFPTLSDAQCEAYNHPDIDWFRLVINHKHIFKRLEILLKTIIDDCGFTVDLHSNLMDPNTLKNTMFDRVMNGGERFNMRYGLSDIISFTITNPWVSNLHKLAKLIESHRVHYYRDDMRIREKNVIDNNIIILTGITEFGSPYEIKLVPTLLYHWGEWYKKVGFLKYDYSMSLYNKMLQKQNDLEKCSLR